MKASVDTNVLIHLYAAGKQEILFDTFPEGVYIYEFIYNVELQNHAGLLLSCIDSDIQDGRLQVVYEKNLKADKLWSVFKQYFDENRRLYSVRDMGEIYAISLAQFLGACAVITDDVKPYGPYLSLCQFVDSEVLPFNFVDILILRCLKNQISFEELENDFAAINSASDMNWTLRSKCRAFIKRFNIDPYSDREKKWFIDFCARNNVRQREMLTKLWYC